MRILDIIELVNSNSPLKIGDKVIVKNNSQYCHYHWHNKKGVISDSNGTYCSIYIISDQRTIALQKEALIRIF